MDTFMRCFLKISAGSPLQTFVIHRESIHSSQRQCWILRDTSVYETSLFFFLFFVHTWKQKVKNKINTHTQTEEKEDEGEQTRVRTVTSSESNRRRQENEQRKREKVKSSIAQTNTKFFGAHCCSDGEDLSIWSEKVHCSSFGGFGKDRSNRMIHITVEKTRRRRTRKRERIPIHQSEWSYFARLESIA